MIRKFSSTVAVAAVAAGICVLGSPAHALSAGVDAGVLSCTVDSGWGFVIGSRRALQCAYSPRPGVVEHYVGQIAKYGVDLGYLSDGTMIWTVVAPTIDPAPGSLAGVYGGVTGGASLGIGASANVLIGGSTQSISLEPLSVEGDQGIDLAAGIASITLRYQS